MAADVIANFDQYAWVAVGLFITGIFATMLYEKISSKARKTSQEQQQQQQQRSQQESSADIEKQ
jgi:hypothetical protein